jgi:hypothetical protein
MTHNGLICDTQHKIKHIDKQETSIEVYYSEYRYAECLIISMLG